MEEKKKIKSKVILCFRWENPGLKGKSTMRIFLNTGKANETAFMLRTIAEKLRTSTRLKILR